MIMNYKGIYLSWPLKKKKKKKKSRDLKKYNVQVCINEWMSYASMKYEPFHYSDQVQWKDEKTKIEECLNWKNVNFLLSIVISL